LQKELAALNVDMPIVFITGHADIPMTVQAMKAGAADFLPKPFRDQEFLDAVQKAIGRDRERREQEIHLADEKQRFGSLTPREREVMALVIAGHLNKQVAAQIGTSETTAKIHRGQVMRKMQVQSLADLVRMAEGLGIAPQ
jgi:FixJ family two-component response regulator